MGHWVKKYAVGMFPGIVLVVTVIVALLMSSSVHAGGAIGDPGPGGGGNGGAQTGYGYGWYKFNTNGAGTGTPGSMKSDNWASVQALCTAAGATTITAFIVQTSRRTVSSSVVYTYDSTKYRTYRLYLGNNGGYWQTYAQAQAAFNTLPSKGVDTRGYTFGRNVGWFCSDFQPRDYSLTPTITGSPDFTDGNSTGSSKATLNPSVNNTGSVSSDGNSQWRVVRFNVAPGGAIPVAGESGSPPELYYGYGAVAIANGTGVTFQRNVTNLSVGQQDIGDLPIGTRICFGLSVQPATQNNGNWRNSAPFCVTIAKSPKIQVRGGDIRVGSNFADQAASSGSNITTSQTTKNR
ncbi:MAG: hypothetical protein EOT05_01675 [Candidatus Microsaccharimonas sossegonensis]|uniref:Uncharacterized protein n=1 Tax=Candidatus Microsaccharimonas sossegonensis TaxID=2506948 RepID=A0A4Q0AHG8_9BACT|nr:MAG: hypothetical protein EOT05_01675 [Candidatus Microsaccharimonas sossegonensis]